MTTSADTTARLWEISTGSSIGHVHGLAPEARRERVDELEEGQLGDGERRRDGRSLGKRLLAESGRARRPRRARSHACAFSRDGSHLLTASADGNARLWRARDPDLGP